MEKDVHLSSDSLHESPKKMMNAVSRTKEDFISTNNELKTFIDKTFKQDLEKEKKLLDTQYEHYLNQVKREKKSVDAQKAANAQLEPEDRKPIHRNSVPDTVSPKIKGITKLANNIEKNTIKESDLKFLETYLQPTLKNKHSFLRLAKLYITHSSNYNSSVQAVNSSINGYQNENNKLERISTKNQKLIDINIPLLMESELSKVNFVKNLDQGGTSMDNLVNSGLAKNEFIHLASQEDIEHILDIHSADIKELMEGRDLSKEKLGTFFAVSKEIQSIFQEYASQPEQSKIVEENMLKEYTTLNNSIASNNNVIDLNNKIIKSLEEFLEKNKVTGEYKYKQLLSSKWTNKLSKHSSDLQDKLTSTLVLSADSLNDKGKAVVQKSKEVCLNLLQKYPKQSLAIAIILFLLLVKNHIGRINGSSDKEKIEVQSKKITHKNTKNITSHLSGTHTGGY